MELATQDEFYNRVMKDFIPDTVKEIITSEKDKTNFYLTCKELFDTMTRYNTYEKFESYIENADNPFIAMMSNNGYANNKEMVKTILECCVFIGHHTVSPKTIDENDKTELENANNIWLTFHCGDSELEKYILNNGTIK